MTQNPALVILNAITIAIACLLVLAACGDQSAGAPEPPPESKSGRDFTAYDADVFFETVTYRLSQGGGHAFSADGNRLLVNADTTGVFNAWALDIESGAMAPLSQSEDNAIFAVSWFPDDDRVLLTGDVGGNEQNSLFVREPDGTLHDLLPAGDYEVAGQQSGLRFEAWQQDGKAFFATSTERDPQVADLYRYDAKTYERELVFQNSRELPFPTRGLHVSPDGRWLSLDLHHTRYDFDIYRVDLHSEDREPELVLTSPAGEIVHRGMGFTPDSDKLVYGTDAHGEFFHAWTYDLESGATRPLVQGQWDITQTRTNLDYGMFYSTDGRYRVEILNADARNHVTLVDTRTDSAADAEIDLSF
ncbi:MAG: hypothetical protein LC637_00800, partial [Xanthomonadaceae bacterium]|nr:hypothetical protein [Xanthomonadaceae bacterium]